MITFYNNLDIDVQNKILNYQLQSLAY